MKKTIFFGILSGFLLFILFFSTFAFADSIENCDASTSYEECLESINDSSYSMNQKFTDLQTFLRMNESSMTLDQLIKNYIQVDSDNNLKGAMQIFGTYMGLSLFSNFFVIGLFLYGRR